MKHERANLQDVSVSLESVHECSVQRRRARSVGVLRHLVINRRQLDRQEKNSQIRQSATATLFFFLCILSD